MNIDQFIPSILKVTANENLNIEDDLKKDDSTKTLSQLINEESTQKPENSEENQN